MKKDTKDDYISRIYKVILYIEQNYKKDLTLAELAKIANFSKYHFSRIFKHITGEKLEVFIQRIKVWNSTNKFLKERNLTKIAVSSWYSSLSSFSKAFKQNFHLTPKEFLEKVLNFNIKNIMEPIRIETIEPIKILYVRKQWEYTKSASEAWEKLMKFAYTQKIKYKKNILWKNSFAFWIWHDNPKITKSENLRYDACLNYDDDSIEVEWEIWIKEIAGWKYAVFLHKWSYDWLEKTYSDITNWIVSSNIELRDEPMFEKYLNRDPRRTKPENLKTEIYIPIK